MKSGDEGPIRGGTHSAGSARPGDLLIHRRRAADAALPPGVSASDVDAACLQLTAEREGPGVVSSAVAVLFLVTLFRDHPQPGLLVLVTVLRVAALVHNYVVSHRVLRMGPREALDAGYFTRLAIGQTASGFTWGGFIWLTGPADAWREEEFLLVLVLTLVLPFGVVAFSHSRTGMAGYCVGVVSNLAMHVILSGPLTPDRVGLLGGVFVIGTVVGLFGRNLYRQSRGAVIAELHGRALAAELVRANQSLNLALGRAVELATLDPLTRALNRRAFLERADALKPLRGPAAVLMLDLDHFKAVNDQHGHHFGDQVLVRVVAVAREETRGTDLVARWGGEEFVILLPDTSFADAQRVAERIRTRLEATTSPDWPAELRVSASFGLAEWRAGSINNALQSADTALYAAKAHGRNRIECAAQAS